jgi:hypothetical protein
LRWGWESNEEGSEENWLNWIIRKKKQKSTKNFWEILKMYKLEFKEKMVGEDMEAVVDWLWSLRAEPVLRQRNKDQGQGLMSWLLELKSIERAYHEFRF